MVDSILSFLNTGLMDFSWWQIVLYTLVVTHLTIAGVTIYLHRCMAHRAVDLHPVVSHFFRFWLWLSTGMVTKEWAAIHRKHHAKCETAEDPHSPQIYGIKKVMLEGAELYRASSKDTAEIERYGHGMPDDWMERNLYSKHSSLGIYLTLLINVSLFGVIGLTVFAIQMLWIPFWAAGVINGVGHFAGYRNFDVTDASRNLVPWGFLIGGEELHNNHHAFGTSARFSNKWYEIDVGWWYISILSMLKLAKVRKVAPKPKLVAARSKIDLEALQAVIHHRYDVMAAYAANLRRACSEEASRLKATKASDSQLIKASRKWLGRDETRWSDQNHAKLPEVFAASEPLRKLVEMRTELSALWERSHHSGEQLVSMLQQWCARAESSGVRALQDMAVRLRSYAAVGSA